MRNSAAGPRGLLRGFAAPRDAPSLRGSPFSNREADPRGESGGVVAAGSAGSGSGAYIDAGLEVVVPGLMLACCLALASISSTFARSG